MTSLIPANLRLSLAAIVLCVPGLFVSQAAAQCKATDPVGMYKGSATSAQAGALELTLNLVCNQGSYSGSLNTAVGVYSVVSGSFQAGVLKLTMIYADSQITVDLKRTGDDFEGTFASSADDSGPVKLHRSGDAVLPAPKAK